MAHDRLWGLDVVIVVSRCFLIPAHSAPFVSLNQPVFFIPPSGFFNCRIAIS